MPARQALKQIEKVISKFPKLDDIILKRLSALSFTIEQSNIVQKANEYIYYFLFLVNKQVIYRSKETIIDSPCWRADIVNFTLQNLSDAFEVRVLRCLSKYADTQ